MGVQIEEKNTKMEEIRKKLEKIENMTKNQELRGGKFERKKCSKGAEGQQMSKEMKENLKERAKRPEMSEKHCKHPKNQRMVQNLDKK